MYFNDFGDYQTTENFCCMEKELLKYSSKTSPFVFHWHTGLERHKGE